MALKTKKGKCSAHGLSIVLEKAKKARMKIDGVASRKLAQILEELCDHVLHGAAKIQKFSKRKVIDKEAVEIAAHVNIRSRELKSLRKF